MTIPSHPLVSVIVPAFNHCKYITRCLESLVEDGYPNIEVLLLDDGSIDQTYDTAQNWISLHGEKFQSIHLGRQDNKGIAVTLNIMIGLSRGEYITLLASDDYLLPAGIATRIQALKDHPSWLAVIGDCIVIDENGVRRFESGISGFHHGVKSNLLDPELIRTELITRWCIPGPLLLLRREAFDPDRGVGLFDETLCVEDRDFYLRLLARNALGFVDVNVSAYRVHHSNSSSANQPDHIRRALLRDLGRSCKKNSRLFSGRDRYILWIQSKRYEFKVKHIETGCFLWKTASDVLWCLSHLIYLFLRR